MTIHPAFSSDLDKTKSKKQQEIGARVGYNNNPMLFAPQNIMTKEDFLLTLLTDLKLGRSIGKSSYMAIFDAGLRKGAVWVPWQMNINSSVGVNHQFNNGISLSIKNNYIQTAYDLGLSDLSGIKKRQNNNLAFNLNYRPAKRLKVSTYYQYLWNRFEMETRNSQRGSNIVGGNFSYKVSDLLHFKSDYKKTFQNYSRDTGIVNRNMDEFMSELALPIAIRFGAYISYRYQKQVSSELTTRNMHGQRGVFGIVFTGKSMRAWLEAGYEEIVYESQTVPDFANPAFKVGFKHSISEKFTAKMEAGVDGYKNAVYDANILWRRTRSFLFLVSASKLSMINFGGDPNNNFYSAFNHRLKIEKTFSEVVKSELAGSIITRDDFSDTLSIPTTGAINRTMQFHFKTTIKPIERVEIDVLSSIIYQDDARLANPIFQTATSIIKVEVDYLISKQVNLGAHYQYAQREAQNTQLRFQNTRYGIHIIATL